MPRALLACLSLLWTLAGSGLVACDEPRPPSMAIVDDTPGAAEDVAEPDAADDDTTAAGEVSEDTLTEVEDAEDTPAVPDAGDIEDVPYEDSASQDTTDTDVPLAACEEGTIRGRACSIHGAWLDGVRVFVRAVDCHGESVVVETRTRTSGFFTLHDVPVGRHPVFVDDGHVTSLLTEATVEPGRVTDLTSHLKRYCYWYAVPRIAVLSGVFDHVETLFDGLGVGYDLYEGDSADMNPDPTRSGLELLRDLESLLAYDLVVINSGEWYRLFGEGVEGEPLRTMRQNLQTFVASGGSLLVTDWAYVWAEAAFPGAIHFWDDPATDEHGQTTPGQVGLAHVGAWSNHLVADVVSEWLREALYDATTMTLNFNRPSWAVATGVHFQTEVHVLAPSVPILVEPGVQTDVPLLATFQPTATSGRVTFSAFPLSIQPTSQIEQLLNFVLFQL